MKTVALCRFDRARCPSAAALRFLSIIDSARGREGLARLGEINRSINLAIRPMSDLMQYHVEDLWSSPLATLAAGAGDCEDYAIAKFVALREAAVALKIYDSSSCATLCQARTTPSWQHTLKAIGACSTIAIS